MIPRHEFTKQVKRDAYARSGGICECHLLAGYPGMIPGGCNKPLGPGNTFYEHIIACAAGGRGTLDNCAVLTKTCWRIKTDTYDQRIAAKTKRQADRAIGISRRLSRPVPGSRNTPFRIRMNGTKERRI